jgi:hypothetical protein
MKRLAIPVKDEVLSSQFGVCQYCLVFNIDSKTKLEEKLTIPKDLSSEHIPEWAAKNQITDLIVHDIDKSLLSRFVAKKINLYVGIPRTSPLEIVNDYLEGKLKSDVSLFNQIKR